MKRARRFTGLACATAGVVLVAGCRVGTDYRAPERTTAAAWIETAEIATPAPVREDWWRAFGDPQLEELVDSALAQSLDLALARERVLEARALRDVASGGDDPHLDLAASYSHARRSATTGIPFGPREGDSWSAGFDARWELDLFGRTAEAVAAAQAGLEGAVEARRDATVTLLGELARTYVELRGAQRELAVARSNVATQSETVGLTEGRFKAGMASELDLSRARALSQSTVATIPTLEAAVRNDIHRLSVLLARDPGALSTVLSEERPVPQAPATIDAGLPADLLRRRADVRRAERELARECALTNAARAELYPRLSLAASWGQQSAHSGDLFDQASNAWSIGPNLVAPLFEAGVLRANVRAQEARQRAALLTWEKTVLEAQAEVEDALVNLARERERNRSLAEALVSQQRASQLASDLFTRGLVDFFQVLDAQRQALQIESDLARSSTRVATNAVALYKALGGGWEVNDAAESARADAKLRAASDTSAER